MTVFPKYVSLLVLTAGLCVLFGSPALASTDCAMRESNVTRSGAIDLAAAMEEGVLAYECGDFDRAEMRFRQVLQFDSRNVQATYYLGAALAARGDDGKARRYLEKAVAMKPNFLDAREEMALLYLRSGETAKAAAEFRAMKELQARCADGACGEAGSIVDEAVARVEAKLAETTVS